MSSVRYIVVTLKKLWE